MTNILKDYTLPVKGLALGRQSFRYNVGEEFFEQFENSEIKHANVELTINVNKQSRMIILDFIITGTVRTQCDRCLDEFDLPIESNNTLYLKHGKEETEQSDEMIVIAENSHEINLAQHIFEFINLSLPIKKIHGKDKNGNKLCNPEMIKKLNSYVVDEESKVDPRWNKLKDLI